MIQIIKDIIFKTYKGLSRFAGLFIPIKDDLVFFDSFPDYSDNSRALSNYLKENTDLQIIWAVNDPAKFAESSSGIRFIGKKGLRNRLTYVFYSKRAKYLFSTHGAFPEALKKEQIYICLWHGTPLKRIAKMQNPDSNKHYMENCSHFVSPSVPYIDIFAQSFGKKNKDIIHAGYPRNDFLFEQTDCLQKLDIDAEGNKLIVYLPTFRKPKGGGYSDSSSDIFIEGLINFSSDAEMRRWNDFLRRRNVKLIVKPHPSDSSIPSKGSYSNLIVITHDRLLQHDVQLYNILHYADALITDYSSVFCDYIVLDRPMAFILDDLDEYRNNRGFVIDNPIDYLPGHKVFGTDDLKAFITDVAQGTDSGKELRQKLLPFYCDFASDGNCARLWQIAKSMNQ